MSKFALYFAKCLETIENKGPETIFIASLLSFFWICAENNNLQHELSRKIQESLRKFDFYGLGLGLGYYKNACPDALIHNLITQVL